MHLLANRESFFFICFFLSVFFRLFSFNVEKRGKKKLVFSLSLSLSLTRTSPLSSFSFFPPPKPPITIIIIIISLPPADFNVVTVDDTLCSLHWCEPVEEAVQEHQRRGTIRRVYGVSEGKVTREVEREDGEGVEESTYYTRGMTVARYQF